MENAAALCALGAEKVVSNELRKLGLSVIGGGFGKVHFRADIAGLYRALMGLRAADRVLLECAGFEADDFDALFEGVREISWEGLIPRGMGLRVAKVRSNRSRLKAETSVQAVVHKAAAERLCGKYGLKRLPETEISAEIRVYIEKDRASILLDLSGEPLFKRGYRREGGGQAPLRETTAAALILLSLWKRKYPLRDPFCGSGTIVIEAGLYAWDMVPGLGRSFALDNLLLRDEGLSRGVREEFLSRVDFSRPFNIRGSDADKASIALARTNMERAAALIQGRESPAAPVLPDFKVIPMDLAQADSGIGPGYILTNPPYGKRMEDPVSVEALYQEMRKLARNFPRWKLGVITSHPGFESFFGQKADSCREITNGAAQSYFFQYEELA